MSKIQQLSLHVANLIAAGEVVERPASVVKELVENAVDAGAKNITIEIQNGGMTFLRVTDDGSGIDADDAQTAFVRHATSKLSRAEDLEAIYTLGFRGEALAAICAVSRIDLLTKTADATFGTSLHLEAGVVTVQEETGCPNGTTIIVRDLFFNTPARMKFMKSDSFESSMVRTAVQRLAIAHPEVGFRLIKDGQEQLTTSGDGKILSAIYVVLGRQMAQEMVRVQSKWEDHTLTGYVSKPSCTRGNRANQIFFVNGRPVRSQTMSAAFAEAYKNQLMVGRYPSCVLHLHVPEHMVDVNVHPAKTEVKFMKEHTVFDCVHYGTLGALKQASGTVQMQLPEQKDAVSSPLPVKKQDFFQSMTAQQYRAKTMVKDVQPTHNTPAAVPRARTSEPPGQPEEQHAALTGTWKPAKGAVDVWFDEASFPEERVQKQDAAKPFGVAANGGMSAARKAEKEKNVAAAQESHADGTDSTAADDERSLLAALPEEAQQQTIETPAITFRIVGEVLETYIVVEQENTVLLIDKHAAHERIIFERLRAQEQAVMPQLLLEPALCEAGNAEAAVLLENTALLQSFGYEISDYGGGTIAIRQIPSDIDPGSAAATLAALAEDMVNGRGTSAAELRERMLHTIACKAAIKGGWHTDPKEREALVREVLTRNDLKYCPHGRPICVELTAKQLERQFKRA